MSLTVRVSAAGGDGDGDGGDVVAPLKSDEHRGARTSRGPTLDASPPSTAPDEDAAAAADGAMFPGTPRNKQQQQSHRTANTAPIHRSRDSKASGTNQRHNRRSYAHPSRSRARQSKGGAASRARSTDGSPLSRISGGMPLSRESRGAGGAPGIDSTAVSDSTTKCQRAGLYIVFWLTGTLVGSLMAAPALAAPSTTAWAVFPTIAGLLLPAAVLLGTVLRYPLILGKFITPVFMCWLLATGGAVVPGVLLPNWMRAAGAPTVSSPASVPSLAVFSQALNLQQAANNSVQYTLHNGGVVDVVCVFPATLVEHDGANNRVVQLWSGCAWQGTNSTRTCKELFKLDDPSWQSDLALPGCFDRVLALGAASATQSTLLSRVSVPDTPLATAWRLGSLLMAAVSQAEAVLNVTSVAGPQVELTGGNSHLYDSGSRHVFVSFPTNPGAAQAKLVWISMASLQAVALLCGVLWVGLGDAKLCGWSLQRFLRRFLCCRKLRRGHTVVPQHRRVASRSPTSSPGGRSSSATSRESSTSPLSPTSGAGTSPRHRPKAFTFEKVQITASTGSAAPTQLQLVAVPAVSPATAAMQSGSPIFLHEPRTPAASVAASMSNPLATSRVVLSTASDDTATQQMPAADFE